jgi:hypothetical protein
MSCDNLSANAEKCGCSAVTCSKRGKCCECLSYHLSQKQLPGCCFPPDVEKTYDRSFAAFIRANSK